ncbi:hypothetical protein [Catenovulum sediminis]|uniref:hypothetical protein n=1 Tax=Catenovulum sediminis TaxID=1740262 RepID=UPI00117EBABF|nr:hypothetical protein [Catenovulum sediminis]
MTKISRNHLSQVFQTLRTVNKNYSNVGSKGQAVGRTTNKFKCDPQILQQNIKSRINQLDESSESYLLNATTVTIEEVLLWEFGEDILNLPDYLTLKNTLIKSALDSDILLKRLDLLFKELNQ